MITSLIEMLDLRNFGQMTKPTISLEPRDKALSLTSWTNIMMSQPLFQNIFILRRSRVAILADIIRVVTMFIRVVYELKKSQKN